MKIKITLSLVLMALVLSSGIKAQDKPNVLKLNLFALAAKNFSFQYERALTKKSSVALGVGFMPSTGLPGSLGGASPILKIATIQGISITPEYRWYPGTNKGAPKGFYIAPYLRYANYSINTSVSFADAASGANFTNAVTMSYGGVGLGVMLGAQWFVKGRFCIDWWILGGHGGAGHADFKVLGDFSSIPADAKADLKTKLDAIQVPIGTTTSEITNTSAGINWVGPFAGFRTGLAMGWRF
jgi:hypothetical protein